MVLLALAAGLVSACEELIIHVVPVQSVELLPAEAQLDVGSSVSLEISLRDDQGRTLTGRDVSWASSAPAVATVNESGIVRGEGEGVATISASVEGLQAVSVITVQGMPGIGLSSNDAQLLVVTGNLQEAQALISVSNAGGGALTGLTAGVRYDGEPTGWLTASLSGSTAPATLRVAADGAGKAPGSYTAFVDVTSPGAQNSPQTVQVTLTVQAVNPAPTVAAVQPVVGVRGNAIDVVLTGSGFVSGATAVTFGQGITVAGITVSSATSLTAQIVIDETAELGARDVRVTNVAPGGGVAFLLGGFMVVQTGNPAPGLDSVTPAEGTQGQTLAVTLSGAGFVEGVTSVSFGSGVTVDAVQFASSGSLVVTISIADEAEAGSRDVSVSNPAPAGGVATLSAAFRVIQKDFPSPTVTGAAPVSAARGTTLDVNVGGTGFVDGVTVVSFGSGITVDAMTFASSSLISARITIAPAAAVGPRNVTATNPAPGGGVGTLISGFQVTASGDRPVPTVSGLDPVTAPRGTTLNVTFTGEGFVAGVTQVSLGSGVTVNGVTVNSPTSMTAGITISPTAATGARNVVVTNPAPGGGVAEIEGGFEITAGADRPVPSLTALSPTSGARGTTMSVELTGTGFVHGATTVSFGTGIGVVAVEATSTTRIVATISIAGGATLGTRDVMVTTPAPGGGSATLDASFTVTEPGNPAPTLSDVAPDEGARGQTLDVVLTGSGYFDGITTVDFGSGITVDQVNVTGVSSITVTITIDPAATLGARDVTVTNPAPGGGSATLEGGFTVITD